MPNLPPDKLEARRAVAGKSTQSRLELSRSEAMCHHRISHDVDTFGFAKNNAAIAAEAALDDIYVVRTNLPATRSDATDTVRA
jgi:hypothetical protein